MNTQTTNGSDWLDSSPAATTHWPANTERQPMFDDILWILRNGATYRDLPGAPDLGKPFTATPDGLRKPECGVAS
jgi:hypothetical protein